MRSTTQVNSALPVAVSVPGQIDHQATPRDVSHALQHQVQLHQLVDQVDPGRGVTALAKQRDQRRHRVGGGRKPVIDAQQRPPLAAVLRTALGDHTQLDASAMPAQQAAAQQPE